MITTHRTDTLASLLINTEPCFELDQLLPPRPRREWAATDSPLASRYESKLRNLTDMIFRSHEAMDIYKMLRHLANLKENVFKTTPQSHSTVSSFLENACSLERRLMKLIRPNSFDPENSVIYQLFGLAGLNYIILFIRPLLLRSQISKVLSVRLREVIKSIDIHVLHVQYQDMILWILVLGGLGAVGTSEQPYFANLLAQVCLASGICSKVEVSSILKDFLWTEQYFGPDYVEFWNEVFTAECIGSNWIDAKNLGFFFRHCYSVANGERDEDEGAECE